MFDYSLISYVNLPASQTNPVILNVEGAVGLEARFIEICPITLGDPLALMNTALSKPGLTMNQNGEKIHLIIFAKM